MSLIQDIESAAARAAATVPLSGEVDPDVAAHDFVRTAYWAKIKTALEAAQGMHANPPKNLRSAHYDYARQFREVMGE